MDIRLGRWAGVVGLVLALMSIPAAQAAPIASSDYRLPAKLDPDIATDVETEIWATLWRPASLTAAPYPLVVFLHGNHGTCGIFDDSLGIRVDDRVDYTFFGKCPKGYSVTPNHLGYAYLAERLAAAGYFVVSINANRGVTAADGTPDDWGLNLRRGRLVLKHLQLLRQWNERGGAPASLGFDLRGKIDLGQVGLVGHSRGGEGMRAALAQYRDRGGPWKARLGTVGFKAIYEIGPVDGQTSRTLNAIGVAWHVLLPYCDGDVSDLEGVRPFDRMLLAPREAKPLPKSTFGVYGANHNFYNTEWQESDSFGCVGAGNEPLFTDYGGSAAQRQTAILSILPFMRAYVGRNAQPGMAQLFNPERPILPELAAITRIDRGYTDTADPGVVTRIEDFDQPTGHGSLGQPTTARAISIEHTGVRSHDDRQRAAAISWTGDGGPFFQTNLAPPGRGRRLPGVQTLEFRVSRQCKQFCGMPHPLNAGGPTDFTIQIVRPNGSLSAPVALASCLDLRGPVGASLDPFGGFDELHPILSTARIPLSAFGVRPDSQIQGVRFTFDRSRQGAIYLANIRFSERSAAAPAVAAARLATTSAAATATAEEPAPASAAMAQPPTIGARIVAMRRAGGEASVLARSASTAATVEIQIIADRPLPVTDALPIMTIGEHRIRRSRFVAGSGTEQLVFTLDAQEFAELPDGAPVEVRVGARWRMALGALDKSQLR